MPNFTVGGPVIGVGGNVFEPLFRSPAVDRAADQLVAAPSETIHAIRQRLGLLPNVRSGLPGPVGGAPPVPPVPRVPPMWLADP